MTKAEITALNNEKALLHDIMNILQDGIETIDTRTHIKLQKIVNTRLLDIRVALRTTLN